MALTKPQGNMLMKLGTEQASTSGTAIDFTGIPAGTTMIVVTLEGVSWNGAGRPALRIGDSGGIETTGYTGASSVVVGSTSAQNSTEWSFAGESAAAGSWAAVAILTLVDAANNTWSFHAVSSRGDAAQTGVGAGMKSLSAVLDRVQIRSSGGDTFDAGSINIAYF